MKGIIKDILFGILAVVLIIGSIAFAIIGAILKVFEEFGKIIKDEWEREFKKPSG